MTRFELFDHTTHLRDDRLDIEVMVVAECEVALEIEAELRTLISAAPWMRDTLVALRARLADSDERGTLYDCSGFRKQLAEIDLALKGVTL